MSRLVLINVGIYRKPEAFTQKALSKLLNKVCGPAGDVDTGVLRINEQKPLEVARAGHSPQGF